MGLGLILIGKMLVVTPDRIDPHRKNACYTRKVGGLKYTGCTKSTQLMSLVHGMSCTEVLTTLDGMMVA